MALPTRTLPKPLLDRIKTSPALYGALRAVRMAAGSALGGRMLTGVPGRVHHNDTMLRSSSRQDAARYRDTGRAFVDTLAEIVAAHGECAGRLEEIDACLEVGCGYGRIVRFLVERVPREAVHVCDIEAEAVAFTAAEFGVTAVPANDPGASGPYQLIYLLSVYSHLSEAAIETHAAGLARAMAPGGLVVFTTHGLASAKAVERYGHAWLDKARLRADLARDGFVYRRYPYYRTDYGMTWMTEDAATGLLARAAPALERVDFRAAGLDGHQDVHVFRKT